MWRLWNRSESDLLMWVLSRVHTQIRAREMFGDDEKWNLKWNSRRNGSFRGIRDRLAISADGDSRKWAKTLGVATAPTI